MSEFVVVFDNAPLEAEGWIRDASRELGLFLVDQDALAKEMSTSKEFREAAMSPEVKDFRNPHLSPQLAPHFRAALERLAGGQKMLALQGWGWLVYAEQVDACVLDFSGYDAEKRRLADAQGKSARDLASPYEQAKGLVREHARKRLGAAGVLELPPAASEAEKARAATAFVKKLRFA